MRTARPDMVGQAVCLELDANLYQVPLIRTYVANVVPAVNARAEATDRLAVTSGHKAKNCFSGHRTYRPASEDDVRRGPVQRGNTVEVPLSLVEGLND